MASGSFDTNAILRLLLNDIPDQHNAVKTLIDQADNDQFYIADTAIIELVFVLHRYYNFRRSQISEALMGFMKLKEISCNRLLFERLLPTFVEHAALSFEDCYLTVHAELNNVAPLWTFDKKLASQAANAKLIQV
jgi:predicted nucleic-acid-binding protein